MSRCEGRRTRGYRPSSNVVLAFRCPRRRCRCAPARRHRFPSREREESSVRSRTSRTTTRKERRKGKGSGRGRKGQEGFPGSKDAGREWDNRAMRRGKKRRVVRVDAIRASTRESLTNVLLLQANVNFCRARARTPPIHLRDNVS